MITDRPAVIDTCVLINILATGRMTEIVRVIAPILLVCPAVAEESLYLRSFEAEGRPEPVDLQKLIVAGILTLCQIGEGAEVDLYVAYAEDLDDGEAMSLAIAQSRHLALATDERKALRLARQNAPHVSLITTTEIIHTWAEGREPSEVTAVVQSILTRARFRPADSDRLAQWWNNILDG